MTFKVFMLLSCFALTTAVAASISYIHPLPNSLYHSAHTTVIVRFDNAAQLTDPKDVEFELVGRKQKTIFGTTLLSSDGQTFIFKPGKSFIPADTISLAIKVAKLDLEYTSQFIISPKSVSQLAPPEQDHHTNSVSRSTDHVKVINGVSVPSDFPDIQVTQTGETAPGYIFVTTYDLSNNYWMILKNDGTPYFYRGRLGRSRLWDFAVQNDSILTLIEGETAKTFNSHFEQTNWYKCGHGYKTDYHEFRLTPNGHVILIGEDIEIIDMSKRIEGGKVNARVVGNLVQELDADGNVIFEWRSWDHYDILDAHLESFTTLNLHYAHFNAVDIDYDGNLLISARTMDEITKVDRQTGQVLWRLGGKNNEFLFINDTDGFTYQHDIRAVPNMPNHYTLFDNGNYHSPVYSRAVEFFLDTDNKMATKVWEYRHTPDYYSHWMGNVQRLPNGNTGICWALKSLPNYSEIDVSGNEVFNLRFEPAATTYRAHRFEWQGRAKSPYLLLEEGSEAITLLFNHFGADDIAYYNVYADTVENPITLVDSTQNTFINLSDVQNGKTYYFRVTSVTTAGVESEFSNQEQSDIQIIKPGDNQIINGDFSQNTNYWILQKSSEDIANYDVDDNGHLNIQVFSTNGFSQDVQVSQRRILLAYGRRYKIEFDAYADNNRPLDVRLMDDHGLYDYSEFGLMQLTKRLQHYSAEFTMRDETDKMSRLFFSVGDMVGDVYIDNVYFSEVVDTKTESQSDMPTDYVLAPAFPNPFNAQTTIRYSIGATADVKIDIFDILGRRVVSEEKRHLQPGEFDFTFQAQNLSSGVYFCQLQVQDLSGRLQFIDRVKMMLLK